MQPVLPPNLKRLRTSAVDKLKQSAAPGEDLSTFIPTPTWGSPRVSDLQPAAMAGNKPSSSKKQGAGGLAARAAHAASLLAQAAANSAARSNSMAAAGAQDAQAQADVEAAAGNSDVQPAQAGAQDTAQAPNAPAAGDGAQPSQQAEPRSGDQLASLLQQQRSDDELVSKRS